MIRGLLIRQVFVLVDLALAVTVVVTIGTLVLKLVEPAPAVTEVELGERDAGDTAGAGLQVAGRAAYDAILENGLFGDAGRFDPAAAPPPPVIEEPEEAPLEETQLNLQLVGTTAAYPTDPLASAIIRNMDNRGAGGTYFLNDAVLPDEGQGAVRLIRVLRREVILWNERKTPAGEERLSMPTPEDGMVAERPAVTPQPQAGGVQRVSIDRQEFTRELYENYATLVTQIRPEYYRDASGNVVGLTAQNINEIPLARQLGLSDGDVLQSINNEQIDSEQKVMELFQRYRNANAFRIGILRNGRPTVITYTLE